MADYSIEKLGADTVRVLSAEGVEKAASGHPGMPMGCADFAFMLWYRYMRHNPADPGWLGRDRFILSAGHGSMLLYSLLHLFEYGLSMDDLKKFRQWGSLTPGHPEFGHPAGVEVTTGPLGSGFASGVGMAVAAKSFAARTGLDKSGLMDGRIWMLSSDGCMMEGTTHEAASLAGHLKLDKIICFYDDNKITIEGSTELAFSEDVLGRFEAYGWRTLKCENANDPAVLDKVLAEAVESDGRPTIIGGQTRIGYGAPNLAGSHEIHGAPLGREELDETKEFLGFSSKSEFQVGENLREALKQRCGELSAEAKKWDAEYDKLLSENDSVSESVSALLEKKVPEDILEKLIAAAPTDKAAATRASSGKIIQKAAALVPALFGGAADLAPSTKTLVEDGGDFGAENYSGRNMHFGVRELGMGFLGNGLALYGAAIPYTSTFMVFSDYMKPAIRLSAIQGLHHIFVYTHDSFFVGEDGPTHQPIEHLAMMRSIPGVTVIRPAEANEVAHAWAAALRAEGTVVLALTRQGLEPFSPELAERINLEKGAYVLSDEEGFELMLIATGSEVNLALESASMLRDKGIKVRVVSMPSRELFLKQDSSYREQVLPSESRKRVLIEAGTTFGWEGFTGAEGLIIGIDHFGLSAPYKVLAEKFGFSPDAVTERIQRHFKI